MEKLISTIILTLSILGTNVFPKEWNGITPCVSTRFDAEKILGKDDFPSLVGIYRYKKQRVHVRYEIVSKSSPNKDVVKKIDVYPNKSVKLAQYMKNIPNFPYGFTKTTLDPRNSHVPYLVYYTNPAQGYEIAVQKDDDDVEIITAFGYFGRPSDCS